MKWPAVGDMEYEAADADAASKRHVREETSEVFIALFHSRSNNSYPCRLSVVSLAQSPGEEARGEEAKGDEK